MPEGVTGMVPGIVLVAGSGAGQRNESGAYGAYNFVVCSTILSSSHKGY